LSESRPPAAAPGRLRVLFVNRYYAPDVSATSQLLTDLAEGLVRVGLEVGIVCSRQLYEEPCARLAAHEVIRGVDVWRVSSARFGRDRLGGRALDYATFYLGAAAALLRRSREYDVLVLKTDPPLLSLIGWLVPTHRHLARVNWLQDVFPEVATRLALSPLPRMLESLLRALRDRSLRAADANVVLGSRMREYLISRGVPAARVSIGENWADEETVRALPAADSALRRRLGLVDQFVVAYAGNLGRAHEVDTLLCGAQILRADPDIVFLMTGGGVNMRALQAAAQERCLTQMRFLSYRPRAELGDMLAAGDVHLVTLLPQLEGLVVPSKFYGILAAGRPVVFVGDPDGELARLIRDSAVGVSVACGDGAGLCRVLQSLRADPAERARMGARARALFEQRFTLRTALARWSALLAQTAAAAPGQSHMPSGVGPSRSNSHS
jgi:colanic acid biosynthesis glycosyl transferase WcaI